MTELTIEVPEQLLADIHRNLGIDATDEYVIREALLLFVWATQSVSMGKDIFAATPGNGPIEKVVLSHTAELRKKRKPNLRLIVPIQQE